MKQNLFQLTSLQ